MSCWLESLCVRCKLLCVLLMELQCVLSVAVCRVLVASVVCLLVWQAERRSRSSRMSGVRSCFMTGCFVFV